MPQKYSIRPLAHNDLSLLLAWRNHPSIRRFMFTQHEISMQEHQCWFENASADEARRLMLVENDGHPIGYVQFIRVAVGGVADWGFYTNPESPRGSGMKLAELALAYAFDTLGLHKVCGQAISINLNSIRFHTRIGFTQEGLLRDQQLINSAYHDLLCFGLLANEWHSQKLMNK